MDPRKARLLAVVVAPLTTLNANAQTQALAIDDPAFVSILESGPATSEEIEMIVTGYAAVGMTAEATAAFAGFFRRTNADDSHACRYCNTLLATIHTPFESPLAQNLFDATRIVADEAIAAAEAAPLLRMAALLADGNREARDFSLYLLMAAAQIGIDDAARFRVAQTMANLGLITDAAVVAQAIYADPSSVHYRSTDVERWIDFLELEHRRVIEVGPLIRNAALP